MELTQAIDRWVEAHGSGLSDSTRRDIDDIRNAIAGSPWGSRSFRDVSDDTNADVVAVTDTTVFAFSRPGLAAALETEPKMGMALLQAMASRRNVTL
jgi:CRP-like cAMP-binding protein